MKRLSDFIHICEGLLQPDHCEALIAEHEAEGVAPALVEGGDVHPARNCSQRWFEEDSGLDLAMAIAYHQYRAKHPDAKISDFTGYSFLKYETGQFYKQHVDEFPGKPRLLTISVALNDDFEGGEWAWFDRELVKKVMGGDAVMFPSNFMFPHEILPVTKGTRYSLITWFTA